MLFSPFVSKFKPHYGLLSSSSVSASGKMIRKLDIKQTKVTATTTTTTTTIKKTET